MPFPVPLYTLPAKPPEALLELLLGQIIDVPTARQYYENYTFFESERRQIEQLHWGQWVASVNGQLIVEPSERVIMQALQAQPNWQRAYIENVGRII
jgi:hypothetical protein